MDHPVIINRSVTKLPRYAYWTLMQLHRMATGHETYQRVNIPRLLDSVEDSDLLWAGLKVLQEQGYLSINRCSNIFPHLHIKYAPEYAPGQVFRFSEKD